MNHSPEHGSAARSPHASKEIPTFRNRKMDRISALQILEKVLLTNRLNNTSSLIINCSHQDSP